MNPMQMLQGMRNPQQFLQQMMGNKSVMNNPLARNAMQMAQNGDYLSSLTNINKKWGLRLESPYFFYPSMKGINISN